MPWSKDNPPSFAKNKSEAERKVAADVANSTLAKGSTEEEAIFAAIAAVKRLNKQESQKKAVEAPKRILPSHVLSLLNKAAVEPVIASDEPSSVRVLPISKEFLGENALPVGTDRNLVSVELKDDLSLYHTFDTGERIITDLKKLKGNIENYITVSNQAQGSGSNLNSRSILVSTEADVPLIVRHELSLIDPEALIFSAYLNGRLVDLEMQILDQDSVEILTYVDTIDLKLNFIGL